MNGRRRCGAAALAMAAMLLSGCASSGGPGGAGGASEAGGAGGAGAAAPAAAPAPTAGAALAGVEWQVTTIGGQPIVADSQATIEFKDGRVFGKASCNRFMGGYELSADGVTVSMSQMASTMMACPDPLMQQEQAFLKLLADVTSYRVAADGTLTLSTADGRSITATRG